MEPRLCFYFMSLPRRVAAFFALFLLAVTVQGAGRYDAPGADEIRHVLIRTPEFLEVHVVGAGVDRPEQAVFVALGGASGSGSPLVPSDVGEEGAPVWLPFAADRIIVARSTPHGEKVSLRRWEKVAWGPRGEAEGVTVASEPAQVTLRIPKKLLGGADRVVVYLKDLAADDGRGRFYGALDRMASSGTGERVLRHYLAMDEKSGGFRLTGRTPPEAPRVRIYQLLPRLFGNTNETRRPGGTVEENGVGKFHDISDRALGELKDMGFTHLWLTGVLDQATGTDHSNIGKPADDPDILKGRAGSPYAIRDYFDVSPDYAVDPAKRLEEFKALLGRIHAKGLKVLMDFVPNHVARSYHSTARPELSFGTKDDHAKFFDPQNNFFYLTSKSPGGGPPLRLPHAVEDGLFAGEKDFGRVTGNNEVTWAPGPDSWYETAKLNYGYDFTAKGEAARQYPHAGKANKPLPDTWKKMDEVIAFWQGLGVDGFRVDMAHMVPPEFWRWLITRARGRNPGVYFMAEAYDKDPSKIFGGNPAVSAATGGDVMLELLEAGFDAVYDDPTYDTLKAVYEKGGGAGELDRETARPFFRDNALRYAENHDEVRLAAPSQWGGYGMAVGKPVSALLFGLSRGPVMVYSGQEVGEPAAGAEGFGADDARTSIFDYWTMPEFAKWVNGGAFDGGALSEEQKSLREFYRRLLHASDLPAFRDGDFYPLNPENFHTSARRNESADDSGRWLYAYLRYDPASGQRMLVVVNLHPEHALHDVRIRFSKNAMRFLGWDTIAGSRLVPVMAGDRLGEVSGESATVQTTPAEMENPGLTIKELPPLTAAYYELKSAR